MKVFSIDDICEGVDMNISFERSINERNSLLICEWSNEKGEEFQKQWMGSKISYPLDLEKIRKLENINININLTLRLFITPPYILFLIYKLCTKQDTLTAAVYKQSRL